MVVEISKDIQAQYNRLIFSRLQYRNSRTGARSTRTQIDHDVFEGLPVRHWRKRSFNVSTAPEKDNLDLLGTDDTGWPELPMPRDAHMYSPMSEALLRAARMSQIKKPATPSMDDEKEAGEDEDADGDFDVGFVAKRWAVLPKDMEGPEPEFLAKRRKGLPSVYTGATGPLGSTPQMRKTKIRKVDIEGNSYIWEVLVPDGQAVDGEIVEEETSPTQAPAPGTVVEGLGVVNAEGVVIAGDSAMPAASRRRPPPPKRKAKGPGRGRKKKVAFIPGMEGTVIANGDGAILNGLSARVHDDKSAKIEHGVPGGDTEMGDETILQEGEEGSEELSEGEDGEDGDREEGELSPSPTPAKSPAEPPTIIINDMKVEPAEIMHGTSPSQIKEPLSPLPEPVCEDNSDPMHLEEDSDEPVNHSFSEPAATSIAQSTPLTADVSVPVIADTPEETMPTPESFPRPSESVIEVSYATSIAEPQAEVHRESMMTSTPNITLQSQLEPVEQSVTTNTSTEDLTEQLKKSLAESLTRSESAPMPDVLTEHTMEGMAVSTAEAVASQLSGANGDMIVESAPEHRIEDPKADVTDLEPASPTGAHLEPTTDTTLTPTSNFVTEPGEELNIDLASELPRKFVNEPVEESEPVDLEPVKEQPLAHQSIAEQSVTEQSMGEQSVEDKSKQSMEDQPVAKQSVEDQSMAEQSMEDQPMAKQSMEDQPMEKQSMEDQSMAEQLTPEQPTPEQSKPEQPTLEQPATEQPTPEQPTPEQPTLEPWAKPATEPLLEATSPERRFSYTRVTTSPQAPTPSPPTPIENTFGLKAPYLSPKAPTMSPPTPIARSMSSSPDIPLADQPFRLPPQVDIVQGADKDPASDVPHIPDAGHISTTAARNVDARPNARTGAEHEVLDGSAESKVEEASEESPQHFTDGEEDLLGSLERSLGKYGSRS